MVSRRLFLKAIGAAAFIGAVGCARKDPEGVREALTIFETVPDKQPLQPAHPTYKPSPTATPTPQIPKGPILLNVPYYTQHIGRFNYCLPTSIAMAVDFYGKLNSKISGTQNSAPKWVIDEAVGITLSHLKDMTESQRIILSIETGVENVLDKGLWPNRKPDGSIDGMFMSAGYILLKHGLGLQATYGTLTDCLVSLEKGKPSIISGQYQNLERLDGIPKYDYTGEHAFVLVGIDGGKAYINDPLQLDKKQYSGRKDIPAAERAVPYDLESLTKMAGNSNVQIILN